VEQMPNDFISVRYISKKGRLDQRIPMSL
jgi:hypothetical protein